MTPWMKSLVVVMWMGASVASAWNLKLPKRETRQNPAALATDLHKIFKGVSGQKNLSVAVEDVKTGDLGLMPSAWEFFLRAIVFKPSHFERCPPSKKGTVIKRTFGKSKTVSLDDKKKQARERIFEFMRNQHQEEPGEYDLERVNWTVNGSSDVWKWTGELRGYDEIAVALEHYAVDKTAKDNNDAPVASGGNRPKSVSEETWYYNRSDGKVTYHPVLGQAE